MTQNKHNQKSPRAVNQDEEEETTRSASLSLSQLVDAAVMSEEDKEDPEEDFLLPGDGLAGFGVVDIAAGQKTARPLDRETALNILRGEEGEEIMMDEIDDYAASMGDEVDDYDYNTAIENEIEEDFAERQYLNTGAQGLFRKLSEHTADTPELSGGDIDAAWEEADVGEETVGGSVPTPDQDNVDELGEAVGLTYADDEPLGIDDKLEERDRHRWELNPDSAEDEEEER
ncbi:MAG: hypothetical protein IPL78_17300 [Chloroflexi bacterium]|nr:hypothetical protein [Chloroflexota bacterium]